MTAESPQKERSVPKPAFTDAEAGALEFPSWQSRSYNYFTPRKRKATVYEDVTVDVQPDPARHLTQGWIYAFADGTAGYPLEWTALRSSNWHAFLDPNEEWEQTIYRNNANVVRQVQQTIANAKAAHAFEPLVGELFRSNFVMQAAAPNGDYVTPALMGTGEADTTRDQRGARHLFKLLVEDAEHGGENRSLLQQWVDKWTPLTADAARSLQPVWSQAPEKVVRFEDSFASAQARFEGFLDELSLQSPKEL